MLEVYSAPQVPSEKVTTQFVRDELLRCFESANREFARLLAQPITEQALKEQVKGLVESVFAQCGVSYSNPTKSGILLAMSECKNNAEKMMGPQGAGIIGHHYDEMMKLVNRLD